MDDRFGLALALRRNGMIASPALRRLTRWFLPARFIARRYARRLFDLTAGFVYSQVLQALVTSGLVSRLACGPATLTEAAEVAALDIDATLALLRGAASLDLVEEREGRWLLGPLGAALAAMPGLPAMIEHHRLLYADLADPLAMLRRHGDGSLARLWRYDDGADPADAAAYSALMAATQPMVAEQIVDAYDIGGHDALLDVGGGTGRFLTEANRRAPRLRLGLFDRPDVIDAGAARIDPSVARHAGDFLGDQLPSGYDLISLVRILHDHDDPPATRLLTNVRQALPTRGTLLIAEPLADTAGAQPMGHAYFGMYLAAMRSGRPRTFNEYKTMLRAAGFTGVRRHRTTLPIVASVITARG